MRKRQYKIRGLYEWNYARQNKIFINKTVRKRGATHSFDTNRAVNTKKQQVPDRDLTRKCAERKP